MMKVLKWSLYLFYGGFLALMMLALVNPAKGDDAPRVWNPPAVKTDCPCGSCNCTKLPPDGPGYYVCPRTVGKECLCCDSNACKPPQTTAVAGNYADAVAAVQKGSVIFLYVDTPVPAGVTGVYSATKEGMGAYRAPGVYTCRLGPNGPEMVPHLTAKPVEPQFPAITRFFTAGSS